MFVYFVSFFLYNSSLNALFEYETEDTNKAIWFGNSLVIIFWISWTITLALLYKRHNLRSIDVYLFSLSLVIIPSLVTFFLSYDLRKEDIKQIIEIHGVDFYNKSDLYTINYKWHHYSGYFGLFATPFYLVLTLSI